MPEIERATSERLGGLFGELSKNPEPALGPRPGYLDPWQHRDWRKVFASCRAAQGEVGAEIIWGGADDVDDDSIRFYCNTAPVVGGKRAVEGDKFWATPWYDTGDLERRSFYLERFLTGLALVDGKIANGMVDASHGVLYDQSYRLLKDDWPAIVPSSTIQSALRAWIENAWAPPRSSR